MQGLFARFGEHQGEMRDHHFIHACEDYFCSLRLLPTEVMACAWVGLAVSLADCLLPPDIQSLHSVGVAILSGSGLVLNVWNPVLSAVCCNVKGMQLHIRAV